MIDGTNSKYSVSLINKEGYDNWNNFVEQSPEGTIFHRTDWLDIFGDFFILGCYNKNNELIGGMPCFLTKINFKKAIANPTLTPYQGVIFQKIEGKNVNKISIRKEITRHILEFLNVNYKNILIRTPPGVTDIQPYIWNGFKSSVGYTYLLNINNINEIEASMSKSLRRGIRKAIKDKLKVIETEDFDIFFELVKKTFERQNKSVSFWVHAKKMEERLSKKNKRKIFLTLKDGKPIGGVYIIFDSKRAYYLLGGYDAKDSHYGASALAMWTAIKYSKEKLNLKEFDFEGSMVPQIERFFRQFGGQLCSTYLLEKKEEIRLWRRAIYKLLNYALAIACKTKRIVTKLK